MSEMSRRFNFDDFDAQIEEALEEHSMDQAELDARMAEEDQFWAEQAQWFEHDTGIRPGEIGGVAIQLSFLPKQQPTFWDDVDE